MWKQAAMGAAALLIGGSMIVHAQQQPGNPGAPAAAQPQAPAAQQPAQDAGWRQGGWRHASPQDLAAFADARIAALHAGLELKADQEKNWPAFEQALRDMSKMRIARIEERQKRMSELREPRDQQPSQTPPNPIERLQRRADAMTTRGTALKHLADAAAPLYQSLDDAQKRRFMVLARALRPHERHQAMWRGRFGDDMQRHGMERPGMEGEFGHHRFGDHGGMRDQRRGDEEDYRGPL